MLGLSIGLCPAVSGRGADDKGKAPAVEVTVDTSECPELAGWAKKARGLVEEWHPRIARMLPSNGFTPPAHVKLVFRKRMRGIAYTSGSTIVISARWLDKHPDDYGMVVHELTHVVQAYSDGDPGWLVEGIADYVRFFHYEPKTKIEVDAERASYRDGYRTTARFLAWIERKKDRDILRVLNAAIRQGKYKDKLFRTRTGKSLDELWAAFIESVRAEQK
jgi:hypothetical protein